MFTSLFANSQRIIYFFILVVAVKTYPTCQKQDNDEPIYFLHQEDCGRFWQCSNGLAYLFKCPLNLHFNSKTNVCDYPQNVKCVISTEGLSNYATLRLTRRSSYIRVLPAQNPNVTALNSMSSSTYKNSLTPSNKITDASVSIRSTIPKEVIHISTGTKSNNKVSTCPTKVPTFPTTIKTTATVTERHTTDESISKNTPDQADSEVTSEHAKEETITESQVTTDFTNIIELSSSLSTTDSRTESIVSEETSKAPTFLTTSQISNNNTTTSVMSTTQVDMDYICQELSSEYFITAHPNICNLFIACSFGKAYIMTCSNNLWYNSELARCVDPLDSDCKTSKIIPTKDISSTTQNIYESICDNEINGSYKYHPFDCEKFIVCVHGSPFIMHCSASLYFDLSLKQCVYSHQSACNSFIR